MAEELQQDGAQTTVNFLDDIVETTRLKPEDEAYDVAKEGLKVLLKDLVKPEYQGAGLGDLMAAEGLGHADLLGHEQ